MSLYGSRYVWIIPGWYQNKWWKSELIEDSLSCTESEMNEAVRGYIACDNVRMSPSKEITVSGQVKCFASSQTKANQLSASFFNQSREIKR